MKNCKIISIFFVCALFFSTLSVLGQVDENTHLINQYFQLNKEATSVVATKAANATFQSKINEVNLNQIGGENQIEIKSSNSNSQVVNQKGQDNYYQFINYYNNSPSNFNILQQGNSNSLQIYGQNSIIEKLSIVQKTNAKSIIIKNY